tara:strand:- start:3922 stop:4629 length:708 start_codon:yes stop_codon:yes gene_type:complete
MKSRNIIIIPTYNEELNLGDLLEKLKSLFSDFFLLVVDDSPNNLTQKIFENHKTDNCKLIHRNEKLGRGSAIRVGFEYAIKNNYSIIIEMDSDLSHNPEHLIDMIKKFKESDSDIIIGSRYLKESKILNWPKRRIIFSNLGNFLARFLFDFSIKDYTNGYRVYNDKFIKKVIEKKQVNKGFIYLTEILVVAIRNGFKISEYPINFVDRAKGETSLRLNNIIESFWGILKLKFKNF